VSSSRAFKGFVGLLLVITLGWKWVAISQGIRSSTNVEEERTAEQRLSDFLVRHHFYIAGSREVVFGMQLVLAVGGPCQMKLVLSSSRGWHRDLIQNLKVGAVETFVVFDGRRYEEQPTWLTVPDFLWARFLSGIGFSKHPRPVITVIAGGGCDASRLPWQEVK
jgi:hypothetical protein